jgi:hypothetical protein
LTGSAVPAPIVPTPAALVVALRGRRIIVGVPGVGFRGDLRADNPVVRGGQTFVPVLAELDYYRAEVEQIEAFAPLVPVHRVWVEQVGSSHHQTASTLDAPAVAVPVPVTAAGRIAGRRLVRAVPDGHVRDLRAVTEVYESESGSPAVRVCDEAEWYVWAFAGTTPLSTAVDAASLWVEG